MKLDLIVRVDLLNVVKSIITIENCAKPKTQF